MPRYFFHIHNGTGLTEDQEGRELPDIAAAREEAVSGIRSIVSEEALRGQLDLDGRIEVCDAAGSTLLVQRFAEAFEINPGPAARTPETSPKLV
jgi:hypothetical protein